MVNIRLEEPIPFIVISSVPNKPGIGAKICKALANENINIVSLIVFTAPGKEKADMLLEVDRESVDAAFSLLYDIQKDIQAVGIFSTSITPEELITVVIEMPNITSTPGIGAKIFDIFAENNINVWAFIGGGGKNEIKLWLEKAQIDKQPEILEKIKEELTINYFK